MVRGQEINSFKTFIAFKEFSDPEFKIRGHATLNSKSVAHDKTLAQLQNKDAALYICFITTWGTTYYSYIYKSIVISGMKHGPYRVCYFLTIMNIFIIERAAQVASCWSFRWTLSEWGIKSYGQTLCLLHPLENRTTMLVSTYYWNMCKRSSLSPKLNFVNVFVNCTQHIQKY